MCKKGNKANKCSSFITYVGLITLYTNTKTYLEFYTQVPTKMKQNKQKILLLT